MELKQAWDIQQKLFGTSHQCDMCPYKVEEVAKLPYGEGWTQYWSSYCELGERPYDKPHACPAFQDYLIDNQPEENNE